MKYEARVLGLDGQIEELVLLDVQGKHLTCFASICPYEIVVGSTYPVELIIRIFDEPNVEQVGQNDADSINWINGFRYSITGRLSKGALVSMGLAFKEDDDFSGIDYLDGQILKIDVDRLDSHFCE